MTPEEQISSLRGCERGREENQIRRVCFITARELSSNKTSLEWMLGETAHQSRDPPINPGGCTQGCTPLARSTPPPQSPLPVRARAPFQHWAAGAVSVHLSPRPALKSFRATRSSLLPLEGYLTGSRKCLSQVSCALLNNNGTLSNLAVFVQIWNYSKIKNFLRRRAGGTNPQSLQLSHMSHQKTQATGESCPSVHQLRR